MHPLTNDFLKTALNFTFRNNTEVVYINLYRLAQKTLTDFERFSIICYKVFLGIILEGSKTILNV